MPSRNWSGRRLVITLVACLALATVAIALRIPILGMEDFHSYSAATRRALGGVPIYTSLQLSGSYSLPEITNGRGFAYPPTAISLLLPSAVGDLVGIPFMLASLVLMSLVIIKIVEAELAPRAWLGWAVVGLILLSPASGDAIYVGQVTPLLAAGYGASWLWPRWSGFIAVTGAAVKVYPLVLLAWSFRRGVNLLWPVVAGCALVAATTIWLGPSQWIGFLVAWHNARPQCVPPSLGSFACSFGSAGSVAGIGLALALAFVALRARRTDFAFLLVALASVVAAPDVFPNYLLIVIVGALPLTCRTGMRFLTGGSATSEKARLDAIGD